jgi:hypothetical protein
VVTTSLRTFTERPEDPVMVLLLAQDALALGLAAWFVWAVVEISDGATPASLRATARGGAVAALVASVAAGIHGHVMLALEAPRWLFVPSPLVADLPMVCALVAWFGVLGVLAGVGRERAMGGLPGLCTVSLALISLSALGNLVDGALRTHRLFWITDPERPVRPEVESIVASAYDLPQLVLPLVANLAGMIGFLVILVVLMRVRLGCPAAAPGPGGPQDPTSSSGFSIHITK